jgi:hypothetical protein
VPGEAVGFPADGVLVYATDRIASHVKDGFDWIPLDVTQYILRFGAEDNWLPGKRLHGNLLISHGLQTPEFFDRHHYRTGLSMACNDHRRLNGRALDLTGLLLEIERGKNTHLQLPFYVKYVFLCEMSRLPESRREIG